MTDNNYTKDNYLHNDNIKRLIEQEKQTIKQYIKKDLSSTVNFINEVTDYSFAKTGKLIRPLLTVAFAKAFSYQNGDIIYQLATMIEYIHTATLLHDDIVDNSDLRRGNLTVNKQFNNSTAVLVGDFIYTRAFQLMLVANSLEIMQIMADSTNKISEGEILQLINIGNYDINTYLEIIESKTANLFIAAAKIAAILAKIKSEKIKLVVKFARNLGILFQMTDDIRDYIAIDIGKIGKPIGQDLTEGKITLPIIYALDYANANEKQKITNIINDNKNNTQKINQQQNLDYIISIFNKYNIIDKCQLTINKYYNQAYDSLNLLFNQHQITQDNIINKQEYIDMLKYLPKQIIAL